MDYIDLRDVLAKKDNTLTMLPGCWALNAITPLTASKNILGNLRPSPLKKPYPDSDPQANRETTYRPLALRWRAVPRSNHMKSEPSMHGRFLKLDPANVLRAKQPGLSNSLIAQRLRATPGVVYYVLRHEHSQNEHAGA